MELVLYCPKIGYYERAENRIGRQGDYYTSVSVGPLFGRLLAYQFTDWLGQHPGPVQLVEAGAHDGRLAHDILSWVRTQRPACFERLEYWIIEPSSNRQKWQEQTLNEFAGKVRWFTEFPTAVTGVIFSNELLDALPFQRFGWDAGIQCWFEWCVTQDFSWTRVPADLPGDLNIPDELAAVFPDGFTLEYHSAAGTWWQTAARSLRAGKLLAIDYLVAMDELIRPERIHGTASAYRSHRVSADLLADPGEQDLTSHVNVTLLQGIGETEGLTTETFSTQANFLIRLLPGVKVDTQQFQTLTHPEHLGERFRVFIQSRSHGQSRI